MPYIASMLKNESYLMCTRTFKHYFTTIILRKEFRWEE